jgi:hypothetical protein
VVARYTKQCDASYEEVLAGLKLLESYRSGLQNFHAELAQQEQRLRWMRGLAMLVVVVAIGGNTMAVILRCSQRWARRWRSRPALPCTSSASR